MDSWKMALEYVTPVWRDLLSYLPVSDRDRVQEIRMRLFSPLTVSLPDGQWYVNTASRLTRSTGESLVMCDRRGVEDTFLRLCGYAVHAHESELNYGFIRAENGCRCGVAGDIVTHYDGKRTFRRITSLCLRIAREHKGCAGELINRIFGDGNAHSLLLVGEPASGKTSLLRDLAQHLSDPEKGDALRVAVVDERGELGDLDTLHHCDVLTGCTKAVGMLQAIRCLSPDLIILDELGGEDEISAIRQSLQCGVSVVASIHAADIEALKHRPMVKELLQERVFEHIALLSGRAQPCKVKQLYTGGA